MMKQTLEEQISQIKNMMGSINEDMTRGNKIYLVYVEVHNRIDLTYAKAFNDPTDARKYYRELQREMEGNDLDMALNPKIITKEIELV